MGNEADDIINELLNISGRIRKKKKKNGEKRVCF